MYIYILGLSSLCLIFLAKLKNDPKTRRKEHALPFRATAVVYILQCCATLNDLCGLPYIVFRFSL